MRPSILLLLILTLPACGGFDLWKAKNDSEREIASLTMNHLLVEETQNFSNEIDDKLHSLHSYYLIGQKNLADFDQGIAENDLEELYEGRSYLNLLAVRTQTDEIENELFDLVESSTAAHAAKVKILKDKIQAFADRSALAHASMENLAERLEIDIKHTQEGISQKDIEASLTEAEGLKDFQIFQKNIEHLSHMMEIKVRSDVKKWKASAGEAGNLTGQEFPAKVWALTFDNGPGLHTTPKVLHHLKSKNLKATFFEIALKVKKHPETSKLLRDAGMEIGSHSYSHKELTKVGGITLQKEITLATDTIEKNLKIDVQFFRLPFGSGINTPSVRETIARNNLIHVFWNVDSLDWMAQHPDKIVERVKKLMRKTPRDAGVIVFHDVHMRGVTASSEIMDHLKNDGRRTCTLGRIVKEMNEGSTTVCSKN